MQTYSDMANWLVSRGATQPLREIVTESLSSRSPFPHPDPVDAQALLHARLGRSIMLCSVSDYLYHLQSGTPVMPLPRLMFEAWLAMDCPGLVDVVVVRVLERYALFDEFRASSKTPKPGLTPAA